MAGLALRGEVLSPPTRLDSDAELFHGLTPTAKCCRRFAAYSEPPGWRPGIALLTWFGVSGVMPAFAHRPRFQGGGVAAGRSLAGRRPPPTASAFACRLASATPPQGGSDMRLA